MSSRVISSRALLALLLGVLPQLLGCAAAQSVATETRIATTGCMDGSLVLLTGNGAPSVSGELSGDGTISMEQRISVSPFEGQSVVGTTTAEIKAGAATGTGGQSASALVCVAAAALGVLRVPAVRTCADAAWP